MNIESVRSKIGMYKGRKVFFRFNGSRNQIEEFTGMIIDTYPSIFVVRVSDKEVVKSFSYSDVLIHKLVIKV